MKIRMNFGIVKTVIIVVIIAGVLALLGLDIAILAGAKGMYKASPAIPIVSMIAGIIVGIACVLLLSNSYYKFKEQILVIMLGFFSDKVDYNDIVLIRQDIENGELYLIVNDKTGAAVSTQVALKVNVSAAKTDAFLAEMRKHIPDITVELFTKPKKKKKDN